MNAREARATSQKRLAEIEAKKKEQAPMRRAARLAARRTAALELRRRRNDCLDQMTPDVQGEAKKGNRRAKHGIYPLSLQEFDVEEMLALLGRRLVRRGFAVSIKHDRSYEQVGDDSFAWVPVVDVEVRW